MFLRVLYMLFAALAVSFAQPAGAAAAPAADPVAVPPGMVFYMPVVQMVPLERPVSQCTKAGDGMVAMTPQHHLCICDGPQALWIDLVDRAACQWDKP